MDHKVRVVLGVPVYKDHKVIGVLGGSCNVTALSHMLFNDLFDGAGNSLLATSYGEIIAFDSGSASGTEITYGIFLNITEKKISKESMLFRIFRKILKLAKVVW